MTKSSGRTKSKVEALRIACEGLQLAEDGPMNRGRSALSERLERTQKRPLTLRST